jgi:hypothetical protein
MLLVNYQRFEVLEVAGWVFLEYLGENSWRKIHVAQRQLIERFASHDKGGKRLCRHLERNTESGQYSRSTLRNPKGRSTRTPVGM